MITIDEQIVRRVAELMGVEVEPIPMQDKVILCKNWDAYDPITDDAQCFAVLLRMRLSGPVFIGKRSVTWSTRAKDTYIALPDKTDAACRRAIIECFVKGSENG
jgi:hypothetical protein